MSTIRPSAQNRLTMVAEGVVGRPRISGDGRVVVWNQQVDGQDEIFKYQDGKVSQVTHNDCPDIEPAVNEDGSVIVWSHFTTPDPRDPSGHFDIYENRNGEEHPICTDPGNQMSPAVSPDGKVIAYDNDGDGKWSFWNIGKWENGQNEAVTTGKHVNEFPFLSGDGKTVYWRNLDTKYQRVFLRDQNGTVKPYITTRGDQVWPSVTPDGRALLFTDNSKGDDDIVMFADGKTTVVAGERKVDETWARMSADGSNVVWTNMDRRADDDTVDTQIMLKHGDDVEALTWQDGGMHVMPDISADGRTVTYLWIDPTNQKPSRVYVLERDAETPPAPPTA